MSRTWKSRAGALALTATMMVGLVGLASPAGAASNSDNAKACQKGGFVNYSTTSGAKFASTGDCVSYAARGGTLVPLPDLVIDTNCTQASPSNLTCDVKIRNAGLGSVTAAQTISSSVIVTIVGANTNATIISNGSIPGPLAPGATKNLIGLTVGNPNEVLVVHLTGSVDAADTILEANETNNSFDVTFTVTPAT